jgi:regulator of sigma E protease
MDFEIFRVLQVVFGVGLVIFVHELGHYLAARWSRVRVETFSLGFGPRLLGARIGPTDYQIALIPLGGFCRMAGEERRLDGLPPAPDELPAKSVGTRFFIYSGGVLMNMLFGLVVFPILFQIGVPFTRPVIGETVPGGAAWRAGVPEGQEVLSVNGKRVYEFGSIPQKVALGSPERATLVLRDPATGTQRTFELRPERDEVEGLSEIGVLPDAERDAHGHMLLSIRENSAAWRAGLRTDDRLVRVENGVFGLDPRTQLELLDRAGEPWILTVESGSVEKRVEIVAELTTRLSNPRIGVAPRSNVIKALRTSLVLEALGLALDDHVLEVNGVRLLSAGDLQRGLATPGPELRMLVLRGGREILLSTALPPGTEALALAEDIALTSEPRTVIVQPGEAAERAGVRSLDEVVAVDGTEVKSWNDLHAAIQLAGREKRAAVLRIQRPGEPEKLTLSVQPEPRAIADYGLQPRQAEYVYRAENLGEALVFGARYSWRFLEESWLFLKRLMTQDVSPKNVGGIITISAVSYSLTESGWIKFFFFLCLVSINIAFLNVLPIPVLDGGHLFFLLIEKLKGSPVSNRVLATSQAVGIVLLLSLMVYVTYNDLKRWIIAP